MKKRTSLQIQRSVIQALILRELKTRFGANRLGAVWLVLEPMIQIIFLMIVFGFIHQSVIPGISFPVFLMLGVVPFLMFKNISMRVMNGLSGNQALFVYRHVKPMDVFIARSILEFFLYLLVLLILVLGLAWFGVYVSLEKPLEFTIIVFGLSVLGFGLGLVFSVIILRLPEVEAAIKVLFLPLYMLSGVFFPISVIPFQYREILLINPILHGIELARSCFFSNYVVANGVSILYLISFSVVVLFLGLWLYQLEKNEMVSS